MHNRGLFNTYFLNGWPSILLLEISGGCTISKEVVRFGATWRITGVWSGAPSGVQGQRTLARGSKPSGA